MLVLHRTALRRRYYTRNVPGSVISRSFHSSIKQYQKQSEESPKDTKDPRIPDNVDDLIEDDFAVLQSSYQAPKNPIILAHGLLGFDELHPLGTNLRGIEYWYGIKQALAAKDIEVITAAVPPSGRIEVRAQRLAESIEKQAGGKAVNIIA